MSLWLVTVKLSRDPRHDPLNKQTGPCPVDDGSFCSDVTGQHHTVLVEASTSERAAGLLHPLHVTRIEQASRL